MRLGQMAQALCFRAGVAKASLSRLQLKHSRSCSKHLRYRQGGARYLAWDGSSA